MAYLLTPTGVKVLIDAIGIKHLEYVKGLVDSTEEAAPEVLVPVATRKSLEIVNEFIHRFPDEELPHNWKDLPVTPLSAEEISLFGNLEGREYIDLMKTANFLCYRLLLNKVSQAFAGHVYNKDISDVRAFLGRTEPRVFTEEEKNSVREKHPHLFRKWQIDQEDKARAEKKKAEEADS